MNQVHIRLTLEKVEAWYICTSIDDIGTVAVHRSISKEMAIKKCKEKTLNAFECEVIFGEVEEMYDGSISKDG